MCWRPGGVFLSISQGAPEKRLPLLREASTSVRDHSLSAPGTALFAYVIRKD